MSTATESVAEVRVLEARLAEMHARLEQTSRQAQATLWLAGLLAAAMIGFAAFAVHTLTAFQAEAGRERSGLERAVGELKGRMDGEMKEIGADLDREQETNEDQSRELDRLESRIVLLQAEVEKSGAD